MNQIVSVDQALNAAPREPKIKPTHDFAHELAKDQARNDVATARTAVASQNEQFAGKEPGGTLPEAAEAIDEKAMLANNELDATEASAHESVMQTVAPVGVTQAFLGARVYGLHLAAQGYLSVLSPAQVEEQSHVARVSAVAVDNEHAVDESGDIQIQPVAAASIENASSAQPGAVALQVGPLVGSESEAPAVEASGLVSAAPTIVWPERVVRVARGNQGVSVWLRDYRIGNDEGAQLVRAVVAQAQAHGETLQRIILNGREVWTSRGIDTQGVEHVG